MNRSALSYTLLLAFSVSLLLLADAAFAQANRKAEVSDDLKKQAAQVVLDASRSDEPRLRLAALESMSVVPERARPMAELALSDPNPAVRFAALVTIGKLKLDGLGQAAVGMTGDENASVRAAALFAAARLDQQVDITPLAQMLGSSDPSARGNAAMLLGMLGDTTAKPMLKEMAGIPMPRIAPAEREWVRLQFAEAMAKLDPTDKDVLDAVRASVYSNYDDIRVLGIQIVGTLQDRSMQQWLERLVKGNHPEQVRIAAATALAQMGTTVGRETLLQASTYSADNVADDVRRFLAANRGGEGQTYQDMRELANDPEARERLAGEVRAQAAFGLGHIADRPSIDRLQQMLADPQPIAAVAASGAILKAGAAKE